MILDPQSESLAPSPEPRSPSPEPRGPSPEPRAPVSEYHYRRRVQWAEVDSARIVHFSEYFHYMEEAEHALWRDAGLSIAPRGATFGYARVGAAFQYHAPLRFEEEFDVIIRVSKITTRSMSYECVIMRGADRIATGSMAIVCVTGGDGEALRSMPFPPDIATRFTVAAGASVPEARPGTALIGGALKGSATP